VAGVVVLAGGIVFGVQQRDTLRDVMWPPPPLTVGATVEKGEPCGPSFAAPAAYLFERAAVDVVIDNPSRREVFLRRIRLVPGWLTGGFHAGTVAPRKGYDVALDEWMGMLLIANGLSDRREAGQSALVASGYAKQEGTTTAPTWWIKPDPIDVKDLPARRYAVRRQGQERFRLRLGLPEPSNVLEGPVYLELEPETGAPVRSEWITIAVCTPGGHGKPTQRP
jgi:hypothetical protein